MNPVIMSYGVHSPVLQESADINIVDHADLTNASCDDVHYFGLEICDYVQFCSHSRSLWSSMACVYDLLGKTNVAPNRGSQRDFHKYRNRIVEALLRL